VDVTTDLCKRYIISRQEAGVADATINRTLAALKRMFHLATECTPPKVQFVPYIPMLKENNVRTGFVETAARLRLEQACGRIGLWMLAILEVGCTYGWRHASLLKMRVNQIDSNANVIRLEPGTTKNKRGLEVTMPRRVRELLLQCIQGKKPDDYLFTRANGKRVKDFRGSWERACSEASASNCCSEYAPRPYLGEGGDGSGWLEDHVRISPLCNRGQRGRSGCHGHAGEKSRSATATIGRHGGDSLEPVKCDSQFRIDRVSADRS
jgi:integrase